jgi:3-oxoacyl-[acyl-carrier protein] reductase
MQTLKGKTGIITGASRGVGRKLATLLAEKGVNLVLISRSKDKLTELKNELEKYSVQIDVIPMDITSSKDVNEARESIFNTHNKIDFLINNAGLGHWNPIMECTEEIWDKVMDTNLKGTFLITNTILPNMVEHRDGMIVNVSSVMGHRVTANQSIYCTSKFGLEGLTKSLALEMQPYGIRVVAVNPAMINTDFRGNMAGRREYTEEEKEKMLSVTDVAEAIICALESDRTVLPSSIILDNHLIKQ